MDNLLEKTNKVDTFTRIQKEVGAGSYQPRSNDFETPKSQKSGTNIFCHLEKSKFLTQNILFLTREEVYLVKTLEF